MKKETFALYLRELWNIVALPLSFATGTPFTKPTVFAFYLTSRCNSRCQMCDFWKNPNMAGELTYAEICAILQDLKQFGVRVISFSAEGEVFTRPDAMDILRFSKELGFTFSINSNGLAINESLASQLAEIAPTSIIFSIDTSDPQQYQEIRGVKNGLERVLQSVRLLQEKGFHRVSAGAVIRHDNLDQITKLLELARQHGLHGFRFTAMQRYGFSKDWDDAQWNRLAEPHYQADLQKALGGLIQADTTRQMANTRMYLQMIPAYYQSRHFYPVPCIEGYYKGKILPNGDLSLCPIMGENAVVGNLKTEPIESLWWSPKARQIRRLIKNKKCPGCWLSCYGEDNLRFSLRYGFAANWKAFRRASKLLK